MTMTIDSTFQTYYDAEVKRAYGDKGLLRNTVKLKTNVTGDKVDFRKKGKGLATLHVPNSDRTIMNAEFSKVTATMSDWDAYDFVDKFDVKKINYDAVSELAEVAGDALGLRIDQIVIDAISSGYDSTNMKFGTTNVALTVATLISAVTALKKNGVPSENLTFIHDAGQLSDLLQTTQVTSADYNSVRALVNGTVNKFLGMDFICIASRDEGGLPVDGAGTGVTGFIYHKDAVGLGLGMDIETEMSYIPEKGGWLVGGSFSAGAVVIDNKGIAGVLSKKY